MPGRRLSDEGGLSITGSESPRRRWWMIWAASLGVWSFISLTATVAVLQIYRVDGSHIGFGETAYMQLCQMLPFALLTPLVLALVAHYPLRRDNWILPSTLYLVGALIFCVVHVGLRGISPYGVWERKSRTWQSAVWDYQTHRATPVPTAMIKSIAQIA